MSLFPLLRKQLSGQASVGVCSVPSWAQSPIMSTAEEKARIQEMNTFSGDQFNLLRQILLAWRQGDFSALNRWLQECAAYLDPSRPHFLAYFVGLGGIDLFVTLLCDVNVPTKASGSSRHRVRSADAKNSTPSQFVMALASLMRMLTELLVCHNELGWYYYDRYPGVFFRLLELAKVSELRLTALIMLEHLVLSVGPVLEISKVPMLQELIRTSDNVTLALLCRVIALLIVPGVVLNQCESPHRRLAFPDSLLPLRRIQRVIDSNVLWLIGEKNLVKRLVQLCEVRGVINFRSTMNSERPFSMLDVAVVEPFMWDWATPAIVEMPSLNGGLFPNTFLGGMDFGQLGMADSRMPFRNNNNNNNDVNNNGDNSNSNAVNPMQLREGRDDTAGRDADSAEDTTLQQALDNMTGVWTDDDATLTASVATAGLNVDFSWFVGCTDAKQRWRLRDLTLREEVDDNRSLLCGFGPVTDKKAHAAFQEQNRAFWRFLRPVLQSPFFFYTQQVIVGAQSEILFVLNLMQSTFFFGDVWCALRDCRWIETASRLYDVAFGSHSLNRSMSPYVEQLWRAPELLHLPRFLTPGESNEKLGHDGEKQKGRRDEGVTLEEEEEGSDDSDSTTSSRDYDGSKRKRQQERFFSVGQLGEDNEAFIRHTSYLGITDDDDGFDDKNHQHEPNTIRKLELLRGVQEFWNAQDRHECSMLHEGDTARQSAPLALKIAMMLAEGNEDSCVETSACHALEGYLRCFSFSEREKSLESSPQTVLGKVLMRSILEHRVYNATYVPGLKGSLFPSKRIDSFFALLGELIRYHHDNLAILQDYVVGSVGLEHLNSPSVTSSHARQLHVSSEQMEQLLRLPPLDRQEYDLFAAVILRRMYRHGCDTNLFLRSLFLSLTPGLRSKINYVWKNVTQNPVDVKECLDGVARVGDVVTGHPERLSYIGKHSREFIAILSERQRTVRRCSHETNNEGAAEHDAPSLFVSSLPSSLTLWDMLQILLRAPHRLSLEDRPFPCFFDDHDRALVMGDIDLPPIGPPPHLVVPLFPEMVGDEGDRLGSFAKLERALLHEPHKLLYNMLGPLNAERIQNAGRLCVVTTCILVFVRVACLGGAGAVHELLDNLRPLATASYEKWRRRRDALNHCARSWSRRRGRGGGTPKKGFCYCSARDGAARCSAFLVHGHCAPMGVSEKYYYDYGGCFFRNMFRLLCVWVGHYGACQRYVETLYYCTEVPFAESKCVVLYLMRVLPNYFL